MAKILSGIGQAIGSLFRVEPKQEDENLEEEINRALAQERENIRPSREDMDNFSWVTGDNNPIHRLQKRAIKIGFADTPVMGAHIASYAEQFIDGVVQRMRKYWGADIKVIGQDTRLSQPLYPGERTLWQVTGYKKGEKSIDLQVTGSVKEKVLTETVAKLSNEFPQMHSIAGPIYFRRFLTETDHLEAFYNSVGTKYEGRVPNMLPASFVPATLLRLLEDKTGSVEGKIGGMYFDFLREAKPGHLQVDIFSTRNPRPQYKMKRRVDKETGEPIFENDKPIMEKDLDEQGQPIVEDYMYRFKAVVSQNTKPITYGEVITFCPKKIEFDI